MGARTSRDRVEASVVMIVLGGGKREMYSRPVSAQEVMLRHPQHVLTRLNVLRSDTRKAIVTPEAVLSPGNKYYLVPQRTVDWLYVGTSCESGATFLNDGRSAIQRDFMIASPVLRSQDDVEQMPSIMFTEEQFQTAISKSANGRRMKSPLGGTRSSENSPRSCMSSPRVCPEEDDEQLSDISLRMFSPLKDERIRKPDNMMDDGREVKSSPHLSRFMSLQLQLSPKQEAPTCILRSQSPASVVTNNVSNVLQREEGSHLRSQSLQESTKSFKKKSLLEHLKDTDLNITKLVGDKQQCIPPFTPEVDSKVNEVNDQNNLDLPLVEPVGVHDSIDVLVKEGGGSVGGDVSYPHQDEKQYEQAQSHVSQEPYSQVDLGGFITEKIQDIAPAYDSDEGWEGSTPMENIPLELGLLAAICNDETTEVSQQRIEGSALSESLLTNIASVDCQSVMEDQQKKGCVSMAPDNTPDQQTSNLSFNEESIQLCWGEGEEASLPASRTTWGSKSTDMDSSNKKDSSKDLNARRSVQTVHDILLVQSPNHLQPIDSGTGKDEKNVLDPFQTKTVGQSHQVCNYANTQRNLAMLGFVGSFGSDSVSIFEQAKTHRRAHLGEPWKTASLKLWSSSAEHEQEQFHPPKQQTLEKQPWRLYPCPTFSRLPSRRLKDMLLKPPKKPLCPILESPTSPPPASDCPPCA